MELRATRHKICDSIGRSQPEKADEAKQKKKKTQKTRGSRGSLLFLLPTETDRDATTIAKGLVRPRSRPRRACFTTGRSAISAGKARSTPGCFSTPASQPPSLRPGPRFITPTHTRHSQPRNRLDSGSAGNEIGLWLGLVCFPTAWHDNHLPWLA